MSFKLDRKNKKQNLLILLALFAVLGMMEGVASLASPEPSPAQKSQKVSVPGSAPESDSAIAIEDEAVRTSKQEMYCYRMFAELPEPKLTNKIDKCLVQTSKWTTDDFDVHMPDDPIN